MEKTYESIGRFILALSGWAINITIKGFILTKLWLWFIMPIFNVIEISIPQAIGLGFTITLLIKKPFKKSKDKEKQTTKDVLSTILGQSTLLLIGFGLAWIITLFL